MLEKFTAKEIEQIKLELGLIKQIRLSKRGLVCSLEASAFQDELFPERINTFANAAKNTATDSILIHLTDAIMGNYCMTGKGFRISNTVRPEQQETFVMIYQAVVSSLRLIFEQYRAERENNIKEALREAEIFQV